MNHTLLRNAGLTETEIKVYDGLLSLGVTSAGKLVEHSGVHRKNVYEALHKLADKGLVTYVIENKIKYFQPKDPQNILRYLDEKKAKIDQEKSQLEKEIPLLRQKFLSLSPEIESQIYRGNEGIKTILKDCLNYKEILFIGATGDVENRLPFFWPHYNQKREKMKCRWKLLLVHESRHKPITKSKYYEYKILPKILSGLNVIYIYGDNVANVLWLEKPIAFVVKHKVLADNYRKYFRYLWKMIR
ncbi:MAG TPA: helix-turn-helix domain-containing protein [Candidatus Nanoarchaeia archaeon]|nr:helix-turn-helix domain-containing protein [Candidatus Nanoarchaeia archaeon]